MSVNYLGNQSKTHLSSNSIVIGGFSEFLVSILIPHFACVFVQISPKFFVVAMLLAIHVYLTLVKKLCITYAGIVDIV